jgi:hypothetical protein
MIPTVNAPHPSLLAKRDAGFIHEDNIIISKLVLSCLDLASVDSIETLSELNKNIKITILVSPENGFLKQISDFLTVYLEHKDGDSDDCSRNLISFLESVCIADRKMG